MERSPRLVYVDWLRGLAVVIMMQGHSFHSWMRDDLRGSDLFQLSQLAGGMPATLFLFLTGISLVLLLERSERAGTAPGQLWKVVARRSCYIFLIALLFRVQQWGFYWPHSSAGDILKVDILNTIAVALGLAASVMLLAPARLRMAAAAFGAVAAAMATPLAWSAQQRLPWFLAGYVGGSATSHNFPLFPWVSYTFSGVVVGLAVVGKRDKGEVERVMQGLVLAALVLVVGARFFDSLPYSYYQPYDYWLTSPNLVANKTAVVLLLLVGSYVWARLTDPSRFSWIRQLGYTSLLIYWLHVELVYGRFLEFLQHRLDQRQTLAAIVLLAAAMLLLSNARTRWKQRGRGAAISATPLANPTGGD